MSWTVELTTKAEKQLRRTSQQFAPSDTAGNEAMESDPFAGNVKALQGQEWEGIYRKRGASIASFSNSCIEGTFVRVVAILLRSEKTYR
jgi:hypothetical protein